MTTNSKRILSSQQSAKKGNINLTIKIEDNPIDWGTTIVKKTHEIPRAVESKNYRPIGYSGHVPELQTVVGKSYTGVATTSMESTLKKISQSPPQSPTRVATDAFAKRNSTPSPEKLSPKGTYPITPS
jgi:hypothetical protein